MKKNSEISSIGSALTPNLCYAFVQIAACQYRHAYLDLNLLHQYGQSLNSSSSTSSASLEDHRAAGWNYRNHAFLFALIQVLTQNYPLFVDSVSTCSKDHLSRGFVRNAAQQTG